MSEIRETAVAFETKVDLPFDKAVARCREELAREGFGVLSEIDLQAKLEEKLGAKTPPLLILGACHPPSALKAVSAVPEVSVFLPCNVTVSVEKQGTVVRAMNPAGAMQMLDNPVLAEVAEDVGSRLRRALERVLRTD